MTILITGAAGFVGSCISQYFREHYSNVNIIGIDNLSRRGSENNIVRLVEMGCKFYHGDIRNKEDIDDLPKADWIIDCAANPSVLAGLDGGSLGLVNNNLTGTINLLEKCKRDFAGFIMLSTSRVYSIHQLSNIPIEENHFTFSIKKDASYPSGFSESGVSEKFSTQSPVSLYGATKLASEIMALEYHHTFGFPVWINRCGVIAGPGQFGKIDQGVFSFWVYQYLLNKPLSFIGFGGSGKQARDFFHPFDLFNLIHKQIMSSEKSASKILNVGGGVKNTWSLLQLDSFCKKAIDKDKEVKQVAENRSFDIPLYISDYSLAEKEWDWQPALSAEDIMLQIVKYGYENLEYLKRIG